MGTAYPHSTHLNRSMYEKITPPDTGSRITFKDGEPIVPDNPIIPFIRGDGTGVDIWPASE